MARYMRDAMQMYASSAGLLCAIVLTVWIPGNLLANGLTHYIGLSTNSLWWLVGLLDPLMYGAMLYALDKTKRGEPVGYGESMAAGFRAFPALLGARFVAGLFILMGFVLLVVPGIVLAVRYALLECEVVYAGGGPAGARRRSVDLTEGRRWKILWLTLLCLGVLFCIGVGLVAVDGMVDAVVGGAGPPSLLVRTLTDCVIDIARSFMIVLMFVIYCDATEEERHRAAADSHADAGASG